MITEAELKEMESLPISIVTAWLIRSSGVLIAEVRRLRAELELERHGTQPCDNPTCDGVVPASACPHPHRCFKDGRWLDDGSEM